MQETYDRRHNRIATIKQKEIVTLLEKLTLWVECAEDTNKIKALGDQITILVSELAELRVKEDISDNLSSEKLCNA